MFTNEEITEIVTSQLGSLIWSGGELTNESGEFTGEMWEDFYDADDATPELVAQLTEELKGAEFTEDFTHAVNEYRNHVGTQLGDIWERFGHDLALTRNGHGAGFWDRGLPSDAGDVLTDWAESLGTLNISHGHDSIHPEWVGKFHAE